MLKTRYIPENVFNGKRILGFKKRNLIEGIIWALIFAGICQCIPFVAKVRWIIIICVAIFLLLFNCIGIRGMPFTKAFINHQVYRRYIKTYSYRRLNYAENPPELFKNINGRQKVKTITDNKKLNRAKRIIKL